MSVPTDPEFHLMPHPGDPQYSTATRFGTSLLANADNSWVSDPTHGAFYYANLKESTFRLVLQPHCGGHGQPPAPRDYRKANFYK